MRPGKLSAVVRGRATDRLLGEPLPFSTSERDGDLRRPPSHSGNSSFRPNLSVPAPTCATQAKGWFEIQLQRLCRTVNYSRSFANSLVLRRIYAPNDATQVRNTADGQ